MKICTLTFIYILSLLTNIEAQEPERQKLLALSDGSSDASEQMQAAIEAGRGWLNIPRGKYLLKKSLEIKLNTTEYFQLTGDGPVTLIMAAPGPAIRLIGTHEKSADPGNFAPVVWDKERMPIIERLAIQGAHHKPQALRLGVRCN